MKLILSLLLSLSLKVSFAQAATISKLKGTKVLIATEGSNLKINEQYFGVNSSGKKRTLLRISAIKGQQAIAEVIKGNPEVGLTLVAASGSKKKSERPNQASSTSKLSHMGLLGSYLMNKMTVKFSINGTEYSTAMVGTGFGLLGYYDYDLSSQFQLRGLGGIEQFQVAEACTTLSACNANITYLSGYGLGKYNFIKGPTSAWVGGGLGFLYALSKSSTVLDSSLITSTYTITLSGGVDFNMGDKNYLPVVLDYSIFPSSASVTASYIALRVGWGWR